MNFEYAKFSSARIQTYHMVAFCVHVVSTVQLVHSEPFGNSIVTSSTLLVQLVHSEP